MKIVPIKSSIGLDRLATLNEVLRAMASMSLPISEPYVIREDFRERDMESDCTGEGCDKTENEFWLEIASGQSGSSIN